MARTKSAYREKLVDNSFEEIEEARIPPRNPPPEPEPPSDFPPQAAQPAINGAATQAAEPGLAEAMAQLRAANEFQQQQARQAQAIHGLQQPTATREQKLDHWKKLGMSAKEEQFLKDNPHMVDISQITNLAAHLAMQQGHQRDTDGYFEAVTEHFNRLLQEQGQQQSASPDTTPEFFRPKAPPRPQRCR